MYKQSFASSISIHIDNVHTLPYKVKVTMYTHFSKPFNW